MLSTTTKYLPLGRKKIVDKMSENTITPDQDVVNSLRELIVKVQELCNILTPEDFNYARAKLKAKDVISSTIYEQVDKGRPKEIQDWEKVELMSVDEIATEDKQYAQKYEGVY